MWWMYWRRNCGERPGLLFGTFLIGTFGSRFFVEFIKNPQVAFEQDMFLNMGQLLSIPFVLLGVFLIIYAMRRPRMAISYPDRWPESKN